MGKRNPPVKDEGETFSNLLLWTSGNRFEGRAQALRFTPAGATVVSWASRPAYEAMELFI